MKAERRLKIRNNKNNYKQLHDEDTNKIHTEYSDKSTFTSHLHVCQMYYYLCHEVVNYVRAASFCI